MENLPRKVLTMNKEDIKEALQPIEQEHRLEHVATIGGVDYINDSKATNSNAAWYAFEHILSIYGDRPIIWIMGGEDTRTVYKDLKNFVYERVTDIICIAEDPLKAKRAFNLKVTMFLEVPDMVNAVRMAEHIAKKDNIVLLSPAAASFDRFDDYQDRGRQFKQAVKQL